MTSPRRSPRTALLLLAALLAAGAAPRAASADTYRVYVRVAGIPGESTSVAFRDQIEGSGFSWAVTQATATSVSSTGAVSGVRAQIAPFVVSKQLDRASVPLAIAAASGTHFQSVVVTIARDAQIPQPVVTFTMTNVLVTSVTMAGSIDARPLEEVAFTFARIGATYPVYDAAGKATGTISRSWDLTQNKAS